MGGGYSQADYDRNTARLYGAAQRHPCLLADSGVDASLLRYSGADSTALLQRYSDDLVHGLPGYVQKLGSVLGPMTSVPNAVGLGAFVISVLIEIAVKSLEPGSGGGGAEAGDTYGIIRRVFGEEKASDVRDTVSLCIDRHRMFLNGTAELAEELRALERRLHRDLSALKNALVADGQMSARGFKIWANGASYHLQMLIHEARLNARAGARPTITVAGIEAAIDLRLADLEHLLEGYRTHMIRTTRTTYHYRSCWFNRYSEAGGCIPPICTLANSEPGCESVEVLDWSGPCGDADLVRTYVDRVFSDYEPVARLKSHFSDLKKDLKSVVEQGGSFSVPTAAAEAVGVPNTGEHGSIPIFRILNVPFC